MVKLNNYLNKMEKENIFSNVTLKVNNYKSKNPNAKIISLGVGDVSKSIVKPVIDAMHKAVDDLSDEETFMGYGSYYGYDFLKEEIIKNDYKNFNFTNDEIYISNGTKTDSTSILELFDINSKICISNPMYPINKNGALCLNRDVSVLNANENNDFIPDIPKEKYDIIYICSPSNPTGIAYTYKDLKKWVDYAIKNKSIILYDNVYSSFITSKDVPKSIYEIKNANNVAIEFRSFSKNASFTGVRCSYYVIPNKISNGINVLWKKRTINRFNGADYIAQMGAKASYSNEAKSEIKKNIEYYMKNASILRECFIKLGFKVYGGIDCPFMWIKTRDNMKSWDFFDLFLNKLNIVIIPGIIFGNAGDKYFRVSALASREQIKEAIERISDYYEK